MAHDVRATVRRIASGSWKPCHRAILVIVVSQISCCIACADELDDYIVQQMQRRHIPGMSIAIVDGGKIVKAKGYGVLEAGKATPVTPDTLFMAASISKTVTATAALVYVDNGKLSLEENINSKLTTWKVPDSEFARESKVTLRSALSHTAGLTTPYFNGYAVGDPLPSLVQILDGQEPANSKPVRVEFVPGTKWSYSGGGYLVVQQLLIDVSGKPFPELMQDSVLGPLAMTNSTFQQPLPSGRASQAATGHGNDRAKVVGRWHVYPEMAAAGLWTTASDLGRFVIGLQQALAGVPKSVLTQSTARQMVTVQKEEYGLGTFLNGKDDSLRFQHFGRDEGFDSAMIAYAATGKGAIILFNANDDSSMGRRIFGEIAEHYHWPGYPKPPHRSAATASVSPDVLAKYEGQYRIAPDQVITFAARNGRLFTQSDGMDDEEFALEAEQRFVSAERNVEATFTTGTDGLVTGLLWKNRDRGVERTAPRVAR